MATNAEVEWTSSIKPLLTASYSSFNRNNIPNLLEAILKSEPSILRHNDEFEEFYASFVALSTHYICASIGQGLAITPTSISSLMSACKVLLKSLLNKIQSHGAKRTLSQKHLMILIRSLCKGESHLPKADVLSFTSVLKNAKLPPSIKTGDEEAEENFAPKEVKRPRLDTGRDIFTQLTSVFEDLPAKRCKLDTPVETVNSDGDTTIIHITDPSEEVKTVFANRNILSLQQLNGGDVLLGVCSRLTSLGIHMRKCEEALKGGHPGWPSVLQEAVGARSSLQNVMNDISVVWRVFSLPILEPLIQPRLSKVVSITMGCLHAAITAAVSASIVNMASGPQTKGSPAVKDDEMDVYAGSVVQKTLEIVDCVSSTIRTSTRAGGHSLQNYHMLCAWCLLNGLHTLMALNPASYAEKGAKEGSKTKAGETVTKVKETAVGGRPGSGKSHVGFGVLGVALASQTISLLSTLMEDLQLESLSTVAVDPGADKAAELSIFGEHTAIERLMRLTKCVHLTNLLFTLLGVSFRKAVSLRKPVKSKETTDGHCSDASSSTSDSNTYYEDDFSSSDESSGDDDDDSEPILGQWFEETLSPDEPPSSIPPPPPPPTQEENGGGKHAHRLSSSESPNYVPDKKEPDGFIGLATDILQFFIKHFLGTPVKSIKEYLRNSMAESHMVALASVIKDMDKDSPKLEESPVFGDFSTGLAKFTHSLVSNEALTDKMENTLLGQLGLNPNGLEAWPLTVAPRTLAVLAEVLLLRQQHEREAGSMKSMSEVTIMNIWTQFLTTMTTAITGFDNNTQEFEDMNVEHMQLLLMFFHGLPLMQKKSLLLQIGQTVVKVAEAFERGSSKRLLEMIPLPLSRLLLIVDYLVHNFYDPPAALIDQVQHNLFGSYTAAKSSGKDDSFIRTHFQCREVEESFVKNLTSQQAKENPMKPRFYNLGPSDYSNQDTPKIDGLACSFLLSNPEFLKYDAFYEAVVNLLGAGSRSGKVREDQFSLLDACSVQYHFLVCNRLLACLPPSKQYLALLESGAVLYKDCHILHTLRWVPRLAHKAFQGWTKDCLVKQGMITQKAEQLVSRVVKNTDDVNYDVRMALHFIQDQISVSPLASAGEILPVSDLPSLCTVYMLDAVIAKIQVALDDLFTKSMGDTTPHKAMEIAQGLLPATLLLIEAYSIYIRSCLLHQVKVGPESPCLVNPFSLKAYGTVMGIGSNRASMVSVLGMTIMGWLPGAVRSVVEKWSNNSANEFPAIGAWRNAFANDIIPVENYIEAILSAHMSTLSNQPIFTLNAALKHVFHSLIRFCGDLIVWCPGEGVSKEIVKVLFPLTFDATTEYIADFITLPLERVLCPVDSEEFTSKTYEHVVATCHDIIINHSAADSGLDERVLHDCLNFMETHLEKQAGKLAMEKYYTERADLVSILLSAASEHLSPTYGTKVLKLFNKLFQLAEKYPNDKSYEALCGSLSTLAKMDMSLLQNWLSKMIMGSSQSLDDGGKIQENRLLLQSLTSYIVKDNSHIGEEVTKAILNALIPMGSTILAPNSKRIGFSELMVVMATLAGAGSGSGHVILMQAAVVWVELCKLYLSRKNMVEKLQDSSSSSRHQVMLDSSCYLLSYIGDILGALKHTSDRPGATSPPFDGEYHTQEADSDWAEDIAAEDDDSPAEDSDEESLNNKLCTYTITQKEFMNQHWYHCHTCKMVDGVGVCNVCARVCHKDHDLTYAKYGSFFCDCGAKEDGSCQALVKRSNVSGIDTSGAPSGPSPFSLETMLTSSLRRRLSSPGPGEKQGADTSRKDTEKATKAKESLARQIEPFKEEILANLVSKCTVGTILEMLQGLMPGVIENYQKVSPFGSTARALKALDDLKTLPKTVDSSDQLMTATLGSQEGAFENVRMNYSGDQGQTIRHLISLNKLRRVGMCCLTSIHGKRQHLAVSHEKGKVTILQLSALLKQADSSKRKLTLTRLASAPIPFTVLSICGNPCNEDYLAVCGFQDCHVLTFSSAGAVQDHLVLHPSLETGNYIIKSVWLPGSQTELAIVTADFVKIYNLAIDAISPQYYFLLPSGKISDSTFVFSEDNRYLLLMSSTGYIYTQPMNEASSAKHGPFYITNILEVKHSEVKESNALMAGGGVSIYYSHTLQLLFFSYTNGKSFVGPVPPEMDDLPNLFPVTLKSSNGGKLKKAQGSNGLPLVQWTEVAGHPGLVCCMTQATNNPVILMVKPDAILVQEITVFPAKAKIQDMVAIRHTGSNSDQRTTLILLCEDGSLRIYMANVDQTNYWMSPVLQPQSAIAVLKPVKKKKATKTGRPAGQVSFPMDYFEHCQQTNDVEFGGNDVLQVYNTAQVKHRLNTTGMYVASTKPNGFTIELTNTNANTVMVGVRVLVCSQSQERSPTYLEIFGRSTQVTATKSRWYDLPFTREESLTADKKFTLFVGPSADPAGVVMVDSVKVYIKTKEAFGWPEDNEDFLDTAAPPKPTTTAANNVTPGFTAPPADSDSTLLTPMPLTSLDRLLAGSLEVLDGCFELGSSDEKEKQAIQELATELLTLPTPTSVLQQTKALLATLFSNRLAYHTHKDQAQLGHVMQCLIEGTDGQSCELDPEAFQRLVLTARSVAIARPQNLVRFAESDSTFMAHRLAESVLEVPGGEPAAAPTGAELLECGRLESHEKQNFMVQLMEAFWKLHGSRPTNPMIAPVCLPGLTHIDSTVGALVEIIHAFTACDLDNVNLATKLYIRMLLSEDSQVSFACKQALIRVMRPRARRRRVYIPSPPRCSTPGAGVQGEPEDEEKDKEKEGKTSAPQEVLLPQAPPPPLPPQFEQDQPAQEVVEPPEPMVLEPPDLVEDGQPPFGQASALEALLAGGGNFPGMLDIPPDADDDTMVELAIALSLQDQSGTEGGGLQLQSLSLAGQRQGGGSLEGGHLSDTTASAPGSDDEVGSTAATDGSTLRTSPAEHAGSTGSESGGSNVDSVSGRSSAYGDIAAESGIAGARSETSSLGLPSTTLQHDQECEALDTTETENDIDLSYKLHSLRLMVLEKLISYMPELREVGGIRTIPYMQVVLMLTSDLDSEEEKDKAALDALLTALVTELNMTSQEVAAMSCRSTNHEVKLIIMRLLSVLMSRTKAGTKPTVESSSFISTCAASAMLCSGGLDYSLSMLKSLLTFWRKAPQDEPEGSVMPGQLLRPHSNHSPPDMSPFFLRQYVKGHAGDVFEDYPQLLTEMVLRLPYQIKKIAESTPNMQTPTFEQAWFNILAEYMMTQQAPFVRRQVRKLLLYICGSKDKYRQLRDLHTLDSHMKEVQSICGKSGLDSSRVETTQISLQYDILISMIEHLKACSEVAMTRTVNWQKFCQKEEGLLPFLVQTSIALDEGVSPVILQLLQCALCGAKGVSHSGSGASTASPVKQKKDKDKEKGEESQKHDDTLCMSLVQQISKLVSRDLLIKFIRCFLLESNSTSVRWQAHALVLHIYRSSSITQQEALLDLMWSIWPELPSFGRKAAQFVDLLGYFSIKTPQSSEKKTKQYIEKAITVLRGQNKILANHPNGSIYNMLQGLLEFDGYYLESDPCLVCNNPEVAYSNIKLSGIKVDSKFTTTTQIIKLFGSHQISKISIRISDLKRTKMVRTMNFYYNNRSVQAVVELKNKPGMWHKAKKMVLTAGQTEVKVEFPLPIVACNLMIEYADFYDNLQATAETLQCPRCSASVPANPGVCGNCGENVYQCHKCRAINYDEKDPFLCNLCGFCKYAKFDVTLNARPCCAVDPIENEEDRKKAVSTINSLLEKADRLYKQLQLQKPALEALLIKISEHGADKLSEEAVAAPQAGAQATAAATATTAQVNKSISQLGQRYCGDCKSSFDDLSKIIQKVLASRKELVEYDRQQKEAAAAAAIPCSTPTTPTVSPRGPDLFSRAREMAPCNIKPREKVSRCYGCASATVEHCITLLRALASTSSLKSFLFGQGLIPELIDYNLRRGSPAVRNEVRHLLCLLTKDNGLATEELNLILTQRIIIAIRGHLSNPDFAASVRHEMLLLASTLQREDHCWEQRVRCVLKLFLLSMKIQTPIVLECVALPCLRMLQLVIKPPPPTSRKNKEKSSDSLCSVRTNLTEIHVDVKPWLKGDKGASYNSWKKRVPTKALETVSKKKKEDKTRDKDMERRIIKVKYLQEKYGTRWRAKVMKDRSMPLKLLDKTWLRLAMFSPSSTAARQTACNIVESMCQGHARTKEVIDMLTSYLDDIGDNGENSAEFLSLYKRLIVVDQWKFYLAVKGVLLRIGVLITREINELAVLEETTLSSDLSQGYALKALTELLAAFIEQENIKQNYKSRLVGMVLNGYLSLKKLVVQRTKLIDETQDKLLELVEEMTTGTESETKEFMAVCVDTVSRYPLNDFLSPVFIFERLCSIIFPEENDVGEFYMSLEKDPQQEDFLQGRMLGNPYGSNEPGLGPLMRDVKNKICQDCELVALLEDDTGMELLVCNKIISLDLPVKDVYKKIWAPEHGDGEAMRIVYRMRGLLGDATEDMVNSLDTGKDEDVDNEEVYKMANIMTECGGLRVMLQRLSSIRDLVSGKQLMVVLLKLFSFCVKTKTNRQQFILPEMNTISIMLGALNLALLAEQESGTSTKGQTLTEQVLQIMETILLEASQQPPEKYKEFSKLCGDSDQLTMLLDRINSPFVRANSSVLQALMRLIPFLAFGDQEKMLTVVNHFKPYLDFHKYDFEHTHDEEVHLDCFCVITQGIEGNANGQRLKDLILDHEIVKDALEYIQLHAPEIKTMLATDSENWKDFLSKPCLPYVLRILAGMARGHERTQLLVNIIPILHKLEQVSSDEHIGTEAENLMEALCEHPQVAQKIEEVRQLTKAEKKKLAMAMREKYLASIKMTANEKGQVTAKSTVLQQMEDLKEEPGLTCCICREGYRYQPAKVLGVYTFTKRTNLEEFEVKQRKAQGYTTVSHFNIVHVDCHLAAVRHARGREEWESAALQNANTKCNGLLPLWGPSVPESAFASCLARHNTYLQECTGVRDASYTYTVHDLKHLLWRFAGERSFSEDSGGGGRESNMHMVPYLMHMALYVLNTTRSVPREEKNLNNFLKLSPDKWVENAYETEGPLYTMIMAAHVFDPEKWKANRVMFLRRLLVTAHTRTLAPTGATSLADKSPKDYPVYKPYLMFLGLVNTLYTVLFKQCRISGEGWAGSIAEFVRHNDVMLNENCTKMMKTLEEEVMPCESFTEYCDALGLLEDIPNPPGFLSESLAMVS